MTIAQLRALLPPDESLVIKTLGGKSEFEVLRLETAQLAIRSSGGQLYELTPLLLEKVERRIREVKCQRSSSYYIHGKHSDSWDLSNESAKYFMPYVAALRFYAADHEYPINPDAS